MNPVNRKLSMKDIYTIRVMRRGGKSVKEIAYDYRVSISLVSRYTRDLSRRKVRADKRLRNNEKTLDNFGEPT